MKINKININDIKGFHIGNAENLAAGTGCTVIICEQGAVAGVDVRGGSPATRETDLLRPENSVQKINAVVLSGGSAYGLDAGSGVMEFLEEKNVGFDIGIGVVPIVCQAALFDLTVGNKDIRPDKKMGKEAAENAYSDKFISGCRGAGTGAIIGKYEGISQAMKAGIGSAAYSVGELQVGALTAVNSLGDIYDREGRIIAGLLSEDKKSIYGTAELLKSQILKKKNIFSGNTTLACFITNAKMTKPQCCKLASILHDGYARAIKPVHSSADGDTIFVMSTAEIDVNFDAFAALAAETIQDSIIDAALSSEPMYGLKAASSFK